MMGGERLGMRWISRERRTGGGQLQREWRDEDKDEESVLHVRCREGETDCQNDQLEDQMCVGWT